MNDYLCLATETRKRIVEQSRKKPSQIDSRNNKLKEELEHAKFGSDFQNTKIISVHGTTPDSMRCAMSDVRCQKLIPLLTQLPIFQIKSALLKR
jgi:hypothetical protein